jgi:peptidyl-prolyl cis-trans isomerase A (cyclophilin A)
MPSCRPVAPLLLLALLLAPGPSRADNPVVRFTTPVGSFDVELCQAVSANCAGAAPNTVANFLSYLDSGAYGGSFVHRVVPGFVIQGGSWYIDPAIPIDMGPLKEITTQAPIANEFNQSNVRGTVALPLIPAANATGPCDTMPDSGTSGWFVSVADNSSTLDCGSFTVFGVVVHGTMDVVDIIDNLGQINLNPGVDYGLGNVPLLDSYMCDIDPTMTFCQTNPVPYLITTRLPEPGGTAAAVAAVGAVLATRAWRRGHREGRPL